MTARDSDPEIRRLFQAERLADEATAPGLDALLAGSARREPAGLRSALRLALATAVLAGAALTVVLHRAGPPRRVRPDVSELPPAAAQLASWTAPTDSLLRTPGSNLWTSLPDLAAPLPATGTGIPLETTKGVER